MTNPTVPNAAPTGIKNIVLVHGGFVDGSGWKGVYDILKRDGYNVAIVQNPTISLTDDVEVTKRAIARLGGPVVLVGHSYGGVIVSEAGTDPNVKALVYIAAFAPDKGESISDTHRQSARRRSGSADPAPGQWLPVPRQCQVCPVLCGRCRCRNRRVHGGFASAVGS